MKIKTILFKTQLIASLSAAVWGFGQTAHQNNDKDFILNLNFFPVDNNFAKSGVEVKDGYIIAGQNFVNEGDKHFNSAIIKVSKDGKMLKKTFLGDNKNYDDESFNKTVFSTGNNKLVQVGSKKIDKRSRLWLREIDDDLNVLQEKVIETVPADVSFDPLIFNVKDGFYCVTSSAFSRDRELNVTFISNDLQKVENNVISFIEPPFDFFNTGYYSAALDQNKLYVLMGAVDERGSYAYKYYLLEYDLVSKKVTRHKKITGEEFQGKKILIHKNQIYVIGMNDTKEQFPNKQTRRNTSVRVYNMNFEKVREFNYNPGSNQGKFTEHMHDAAIVADKLYITGEMYNFGGSFSNESVYLVFDLQGKLLDERFLKYGTPYSENRLIRISPLKNDGLMLLGKGDGWRILIK